MRDCSTGEDLSSLGRDDPDVKGESATTELIVDGDVGVSNSSSEMLSTSGMATISANWELNVVDMGRSLRKSVAPVVNKGATETGERVFDAPVVMCKGGGERFSEDAGNFEDPSSASDWLRVVLDDRRGGMIGSNDFSSSITP